MVVFAFVDGRDRGLISQACDKLGLDYVTVSSISSPDIVPNNSIFVISSNLASKLREDWLEKIKARGCETLLIIDSDEEKFSKMNFDEVSRAKEEHLRISLKKCERRISKKTISENSILHRVPLFDVSNDFSLFFLDSQGRIITYSKNFQKFVKVAERVFRSADFKKSINSDYHSDIIRLRVGGRDHYFKWSSINFENVLLVLLFDVTELMHETRSLRESISLLEAAFNFSEISVVVHRGEEVIFWNEAAEKLLKMDLNRMSFFDLFNERYRDSLARTIISLKYSKKKMIRREVELYDRKTVVLLSTMAIEVGRDWVFVSTIRDVTLEKKILRLVKILSKVHRELSMFKKRKLILQTAVKELRREYGEVLIVAKCPEGFEIFDGERIQIRENVENECLRKVMENDDVLIIEKRKHFQNCIFKKYHMNYEAFIHPMKIGGKTVGYVVILSEDRFTDEELKIIEIISITVAYIYYKSELEEIKEIALKQLENNIREFSKLVDRIKNPLAVISGYCEIHEDVTSPTVIFSKIREETKRMLHLLEDIEKSWEMSEKILKKIEDAMRE